MNDTHMVGSRRVGVEMADSPKRPRIAVHIDAGQKATAELREHVAALEAALERLAGGVPSAATPTGNGHGNKLNDMGAMSALEELTIERDRLNSRLGDVVNRFCALI
jgi:hypothetical protein